MKDLWLKQKWSVLSAFVLAALTLTVFGFSRDQGPESAVRRYLGALSGNDVTDAVAVLADDFSTTDDKQLTEMSTWLLARSRTVQLGQVQGSGRLAAVDVTFRGPNIGIVGVRYIMVKPNLRWRIDSARTMALRRPQI